MLSLLKEQNNKSEDENYHSTKKSNDPNDSFLFAIIRHIRAFTKGLKNV